MVKTVVCLVWWLCQLTLMAALVHCYSSGTSGSDMVPVNVTQTSVTVETSRSCGDDMFVCDGVTAACRHTLPPKQLSYIPRLPGYITEVELDNCLTGVLTENYFANLTNISWLYLRENQITRLPHNVFATMTELRFLVLDDNRYLQLEFLREVFSIPTLSIISLQYCSLPPLPIGLFHNMTSNVGGIVLDHNVHDDFYHLDGFCDLPSLQSLSLSHCRILDLLSSCPLKRLSTLDLTGNMLFFFPITCRTESLEPIFPKLTVLILAHNHIQALKEPICLPFLVSLDISYNCLSTYPPFSFGILRFPSLKQLSLHHQSRPWSSKVYATNHGKAIIRDNAFCNENLEYLDLSNNEIEFADRDHIGKHAFANCTRLRYLYLNSTNFTSVDDRRFLEVFGHLHSLVNLSLSNSKFQSISSRTFANFLNLTTLSLDSNMISDLPDGAFDSLHRLDSLALSNNKIRAINEHTFSKRLRDSLSSLTLGFNPFSCSCALLWFAHWYQTDRPVLLQDVDIHNSYMCQNIAGMSLANFFLPEQACVVSHETCVVVIQFCSIFILTLALICLLFRYRWHLRLLMYEAFRGRDVLRRQRLLADNFDFDVFVSYAAEDLPWVRQHLMPRLEDDLRLRLCVHERDFVPGANIVDNIVRCVESSKKVMMVFSTHFVLSPWCQFELGWCLSHVLDYDDALIVVCVDDVTSRQMTSAMRAVVKTTTYLQWREEEGDAVAVFWGRLRLALQEILLSRDEHVV